MVGWELLERIGDREKRGTTDVLARLPNRKTMSPRTQSAIRDAADDLFGDAGRYTKIVINERRFSPVATEEALGGGIGNMITREEFATVLKGSGRWGEPINTLSFVNESWRVWGRRLSKFCSLIAATSFIVEMVQKYQTLKAVQRYDPTQSPAAHYFQSVSAPAVSQGGTG